MHHPDDLTDDQELAPSQSYEDDPPISEQIIPPSDDYDYSQEFVQPPSGAISEQPQPVQEIHIPAPAAQPKPITQPVGARTPVIDLPPPDPPQEYTTEPEYEYASEPEYEYEPAPEQAIAPAETEPAPETVIAPVEPEPEVPPAESEPVYNPKATFQPRTDPLIQESNLDAVASDKLLSTHGLVKVYDGRAVVDGVDINVRPGEIVGLLGPNGAGKTTTFYMIVGLVPPNGGHVVFENEDVTTEPMYKRARLGMGYLPQEESIFRKLTVEQNILAVMETLDLSRSEREERTRMLMERFGITHIAKNYALTCSGGEKRRLTIARSLVTQPSLLMLDEPFSGVDPIAVSEIQNIVKDLRKAGLAILITDHNVRETLQIVDRAYLIYEGRVLLEGTRDFLINDSTARELYLGEEFSM